MVHIKESHAIGRTEARIAYSLIQRNEHRSQAIAFFCPGASYLFDKPLLHYSTMLMLHQQIDIVHIDYAYGRENLAFWELPLEGRSLWMQEDVQAVVSQVLAEHEYGQVIFLGKSIGTLPIVEGLLSSPAHDEAVAILLTPLLTGESLAKSLLQVNQTIFLAIGTNDHYYDATVIQNLQRNKPHVHLHLVPEANHALEIGFDPDASLACLQGVMKAMQTFLTSVGQ